MTAHCLNFAHSLMGRMASLGEGHDEIHGATYGELLPFTVMDESRVRQFSQRLCADIQRGALPFLELGFLEALEEKLERELASLPPAKHLILLGVGGSSLGAKALQKAFAPGQDRPGHGGPWLWIADNIDSSGFESWCENLDAKDSLVAVVSKSGSTIETMAQYFLLKDWLMKRLGDGWSKRVIVITDEEQGPLREEANTCGLTSFSIPASLGGRYSIMSAVGMFPAAFMGMDWRGFLRGVKSVADELRMTKPEGDAQCLVVQPAFRLALWAYSLMEQGYDELIFFNYIPLWSELGQWFAQLWAESLGKEGKGSMPVPAVGVSDQHSLQQMFLDGKKNKACFFMHAPHLPAGPTFGETVLPAWDYLKGQQFGDLLQAEATGTRLAFIHNNIPLVECRMAKTDEESCGRLMGLLMATTLLTGWMLELNPLDQPAVEFGKRLANAQLGAPGYETEKKMLEQYQAVPAKAASCKF